MKNFKLNIAFLAIFVMIFSSCSKEEAGVQNLDPEKATLSFGALLNDLTTNRAANKAHLGFLDGVPECTEGTADYVVIGLSLDGESIEWANGEERLRVDLANGQMFTKEDSELELNPDEYVLDYFAVYDESGTLIWLAPMGGDEDDLSAFVDNALPLAIDLRAGVKKYVEVDVLCYDDRFVNEYGYLFFEIDQNEAIKFCIFGNYCDDDGRHYPASYSVSVWSGNSSSGTILYTDIPNVTGTYDNGDAYAEPVCFALPDTEGEDEYYFEITLLNSDAYGDVTEEVIRAGVITDADVRALNVDDGTTEYFHFREGNCNMGDVPDLLEDDPGNGNECDPTNPSADCDNDGTLNKCDEDNPNWGSFDCDGDNIINSEDDCPTEAGVSGPAGENGCPVDNGCIPAPGEGCDTLTFTQSVDLDPNLPVGQDPFYPLLDDGNEVGTITFDLEASGVNNILISVDLFEGWVATDAEISLPAFVNTQICVENIGENDFSITYEIDLNTFPDGLDYPLSVEFSANICQ
ncbi:hypothetical protein [Gillisia limnaea]|uniref:Uncharacterized protein n=1 Tax=Gillisia limnaea (strain DSM 15749 / LMG 21470 / R-8282) TaxID=865937 RepID=H2BSC6_GILLR|nr:hypothetical protein [Gillisia limnaea]EHQ01449.1 hypothetical protein Gilli_0747 [Gillisia limnaea DSM 15749]